jgi:hypothetical protein
LIHLCKTIQKEAFKIESLKQVQAERGPVDLAMLERTAHALELLGRLEGAEVHLVFSMKSLETVRIIEGEE